MRVVVKSEDVNLKIPVPMRMATFAIKVIPEAVYVRMRQDVPPPYDILLTRPVLSMLLHESVAMLKEYKGLEVVHVETADGTYVSVTL